MHLVYIFSRKSESARVNAEMLGLMVNDPNGNPDELTGIQAKTRVITGNNDMIRNEHTKRTAASVGFLQN